MFEAQYLHHDGEADTFVYSPWFPRGGDNGRFTFDLIQVVNSEFAIDVITKNSEDPGDGGSVIANQIPTGTTGQETFKTSAGTEELVRYKFTCSVKSIGPRGFILFRMLAPVWFDAVKA